MENSGFISLSEDELFDTTGSFNGGSLIAGITATAGVAAAVAGGSAASPVLIVGGCIAVGFFIAGAIK